MLYLKKKWFVKRKGSAHATHTSHSSNRTVRERECIIRLVHPKKKIKKTKDRPLTTKE